MNMLGCNIRESRSGQEAGLRLKGRLLIMMSNRYGDTHMRRHFLRWWVMVNKTFMRNMVSFLIVLLASFIVLVTGEYLRNKRLSQEGDIDRMESYSGCVTSSGEPC